MIPAHSLQPGKKNCSRAAFLELCPPTLKKGFSYQWAYPSFPDRLRKQRGLSALRCCAWDETKENQAFGFCPGFSGFPCVSPLSQGLPLLSTSEPLDLAPSDPRGPVSLTSAKFLVWYTLLRLLALASAGAGVLIFYLFLLKLLSLFSIKKSWIHHLVRKQRRGKKVLIANSSWALCKSYFAC